MVDPIAPGDEGDGWIKNDIPERDVYPISEECEIFGLITPATFGFVSYEQLVEVMMSDEEWVWKKWEIGVNKKGEIEHIIQTYLP